MCSVRCLIVVIVATITITATTSLGAGSPILSALCGNVSTPEKVIREPYGEFNTTGAWGCFVPREARDVNITFRWWMPGSAKPAPPLSVPPGNASDDIPGKRLGDAYLIVVCHGLPPRLAARAETLVFSLRRQQPAGALLEVAWDIGSGCDYGDALRTDIYYCPPLKGPAESKLYQQAAGDSRLVSRALSRALTGLVFDHGYDLAKVHLVGFGVGAHVVGFVADDLHRIGKLGRLTLLDPPALLFVDKLGLGHLNGTGRAMMSEAVHTSSFNSCGLGIAEELADLDVYVDGGDQPKCSNILCSHMYALFYYTRTVERCLSGPVNETELLPGFWTPEKRGVYNVSLRQVKCPSVDMSQYLEPNSAPECVLCLYAWSLVALMVIVAER